MSFNTLWALASKTATVKTARLSVKDAEGRKTSFTPAGMPKVPTIQGVKDACVEGGKATLSATVTVGDKSATLSGNATFQHVSAVKFIDAMFSPEPATEPATEPANV